MSASICRSARPAERVGGIPKPKKLLLSLISILVALLLAEGILLLAGFEPGYLDAGFRHGPPYYPRAKLDVRRVFTTDYEGVFKANPAYFPPNEVPDGFRSPPLAFEETRVPKILFLGDSFTWGHSAEPINQCFVDRVRASGYVCYNTGIPGADPNQYAFLAEKYVPKVGPDYVAVMIYMGNDLNSYLRSPMRPFQDVFHQTNMGWLYAFDSEGRHMTPEQSYRFAHNVAYQHFKDGSAFPDKLFLTSRVGTLVGVSLARLWRWCWHSGESGTRKTVDRDYLRDALSRIRDVCDRCQARMLVFLVPHHPHLENSSTSIAEQRELFDGYPTFTPDLLTVQGYAELPDDHLNNEGHRVFAEFILSVLAKTSRAVPAPAPSSDGR